MNLKKRFMNNLGENNIGNVIVVIIVLIVIAAIVKTSYDSGFDTKEAIYQSQHTEDGSYVLKCNILVYTGGEDSEPIVAAPVFVCTKDKVELKKGDIIEFTYREKKEYYPYATYYATEIKKIDN